MKTKAPYKENEKARGSGDVSVTKIIKFRWTYKGWHRVTEPHTIQAQCIKSKKEKTAYSVVHYLLNKCSMNAVIILKFN